MLKKILIGVVVVLGVLAAFIASRPSVSKVERSATFAAPADIAYTLVSDFHRWGEWSPWDKLDPNQKHTYEGAAAGVGAITTWEGNDKVGKGKMAITGATPNESLTIELEFIEPWASKNNTTFTFKAAEANTTVTWTAEFQNNFMSKAMGLFMDMDTMIGADFEKGLAAMKTVAEAEAKKRADEAAAKAAAEAAQQAAPAGATAAQTTP
ncbi:MAG: SRPBCC family protein [Myxococcaceae bacterium]|nr:SRPBCC family protein [Myxococcaceae bacterium]MCI0671201.1 SRPBCC family protein [Myxococcaceae bacterium]